MLSAQIDKLRHEADMLRDYGTFVGYGGLTSTDPEMIECADLMCDAADTIWELRESVHRERAEADTLRTQLADVTESMGRVEERCAKLREMAEKTWKAAEMLCQAWSGPCHADGASIKPPCPLDERDELCVYGQIQRDMRELGIEVDA